MSDDIVKRLREYSGDNGHYATMRDAADEIERLRALFVLDDKQHSQHIKSLTETHATRVEKYADALAAAQARIATLEEALAGIVENENQFSMRWAAERARAALAKGGAK